MFFVIFVLSVWTQHCHVWTLIITLKCPYSNVALKYSFMESILKDNIEWVIRNFWCFFSQRQKTLLACTEEYTEGKASPAWWSVLLEKHSASFLHVWLSFNREIEASRFSHSFGWKNTSWAKSVPLSLLVWHDLVFECRLAPAYSCSKDMEGWTKVKLQLSSFTKISTGGS